MSQNGFYEESDHPSEDDFKGEIKHKNTAEYSTYDYSKEEQNKKWEEAPLSDWKELFNIFDQLKNNAVFEGFSNEEITAVQPEGMHTGYFHLTITKDMRRIDFYLDNIGLNSMLGLLTDARTRIPLEYIEQEQERISVFFGNCSDVPKEEKAILKKLGLKYRGSGNWPYVLRYEKGYVPYVPDKDEVKLLLYYMPRFLEAYKSYVTEGIQTNTKQPFCYKYYEHAGHIWAPAVTMLPFTQFQYPYIKMEDPAVKHKLKKREQTEDTIEMDIYYMEASIEDPGYKKPLNPRVVVLASQKRKQILVADLLGPGDSDIQSVIGAFVDYVINDGKPAMLYVKNPVLGSMLDELCEQCNVPWKAQKELPVIDTYRKEFKERGQ